VCPTCGCHLIRGALRAFVRHPHTKNKRSRWRAVWETGTFVDRSEFSGTGEAVPVGRSGNSPCCTRYADRLSAAWPEKQATAAATGQWQFPALQVDNVRSRSRIVSRNRFQPVTYRVRVSQAHATAFTDSPLSDSQTLCKVPNGPPKTTHPATFRNGTFIAARISRFEVT